MNSQLPKDTLSSAFWRGFRDGVSLGPVWRFLWRYWDYNRVCRERDLYKYCAETNLATLKAMGKRIGQGIDE